MARFAITKDFDSAKAQVKESKVILEITKLEDNLYGIFSHEGDSVTECWCFTKEELKAIWNILTTDR